MASMLRLVPVLHVHGIVVSRLGAALLVRRHRLALYALQHAYWVVLLQGVEVARL